MNARLPSAICIIFLAVGLLHLLRLLYRWPVQLGAWSAPHWISSWVARRMGAGLLGLSTA